MAYSFKRLQSPYSAKVQQEAGAVGEEAKIQRAKAQNENRAVSTLSSVGSASGKNAMVERAAAEASKNTSRRWGNTIASGDIDVVANGVSAKASGPDLGDMAAVTKGAANIKNAYRSNTGYDMNTGHVLYNGVDTGVNTADFAGGVNSDNFDRVLQGYYAASGAPEAVRGRQWAESQGLGTLVRWDPSTSKMSIAGINVPYEYITEDGNAMVNPNVLASVMASVKNSVGADSPTSTTDKVWAKQSNAVKSALDKVTKRKSWSYNPDSDPAYQSYAKEYLRSAEQLYNRAMGSGGLYGSPTSYQQYQALAGYGDQMQRMTDIIPTLQQQSYQQYSDEQARNMQALEALQSERAAELAAKYQANSEQLDRITSADAANYARRNDTVYTYPMQSETLKQAAEQTAQEINQTKKSDIDTGMYQANADVDYRIKNAQLDAQTAANNLALIEIAQNRAAVTGGNFQKQDMDALGIKQDFTKYPDSNGYPKPWSAEIMAKIAEWEQYGKKVALESIQLGI